nr:PREDICTED: CASP-like protein 1D1 [Daucus carota subsp. sativus]
MCRKVTDDMLQIEKAEIGSWWRAFLFATFLTSLVALVTSKQTETIPMPFPPSGASVSAEFTDLPAFTYSSTALSLLLGILAATGASGEVAYLGLKGNSNVGWHKICDVYDSFCRHIGFSVLTSIFSSMVLVFLIILYISTVSRR